MARKKRAFVLMIVLPVLGLLALVASAFVAISITELKVSKGFVSKARARMIAQAGIEDAVAELRDQAMRQGFDSPQDPWVFRNNVNVPAGDAVGTRTGHGTLLLDRQSNPAVAIIPASFPSFGGNRAGRPLAATIPVDGTLPADPPPPPAYPYAYGYSGIVGGTNVPNGDYFMLKILDCASKFNLNSPNSVSPDANGALTQPNFVQMFDNLIAEIKNTYGAHIASLEAKHGPPAGLPAGSLLPPEVNGANVLALRNALPNARFSSVQQLKLLNAPLWAANPTSCELGMTFLSDFLTARGWRDIDVVGPCPNASFPPGDATGMTLRTERDEVARGINPAFPGRYPINVNTAPKPVLVMALQGLAGRRIIPKPFGQTALNAQSAYLTMSAISPPAPAPPAGVASIPAITAVQARQIADAIIIRREQPRGPGSGPFATWDEFQTFIYDPNALPPNNLAPGIPDIPTALMIIANANPNTRNVRCNPNFGEAGRFTAAFDDNNDGANFKGTVDYLIDKWCLTNQTTEFCFSSMGYYDIECLGRISMQNGNGGVTWDECKLTASAKVFDILRHTSQIDFIGTCPYAQTSNNAAWATHLWDIGYYPEAPDDRNVNGALKDLGSPHDGNLQLSTEWEYKSNTVAIPGSVQGGTLKYQAYYRKSQKLVNPSNGNAAVMAPDASLPAWPPYKTEAWDTGNNTAPTNTPSVFSGSDVLEDGLASWSRGPGQVIGGTGANGLGEHQIYDPGDTLTGNAGTIEFWLKLGSMQGSNEVFMSVISPTVPGPPPTEGLAWRLERYGTTLYSIRYYWHNPVAASSRSIYPFPDAGDITLGAWKPGIVYHEESLDISGWRSGEWHKIRHCWPEREKTDPAAPPALPAWWPIAKGGVKEVDSDRKAELVSHRTYVDGALMGNDILLTRDDQQVQNKGGVLQNKNPNPDPPPPDPGITYVHTCGYLDQSNGGTWAYACWDVPSGGGLTYTSNVFEMTSFPKNRAMYVGGYLYQGAAVNVFMGSDNVNQQVALAAVSNRFTNSTIDEVRYIQDDNAVVAPTSWNRFPGAALPHIGQFGKNDAVSTAQAIDARAARPLPPGVILGTIGCTIYYPTQYAGAQILPPQRGGAWMTWQLWELGASKGADAAAPPQPAPACSYTGVPAPVYGPVAGVPQAARQVSSTAATADVSSLQYTLTLTPGTGSTGYSVTSPIVDDVTLTILDTPQIFDLSEDIGL